ncbi:MAG: class I SAM-dependent methyltransferase [Akkermansia sp.]
MQLLRECRRRIPADTDAFRVMDGAANGYPGLFIDQLGERILVSTRDRGIPSPLLRELKETGSPVFHKQLDQDIKAPPQLIAGPEMPLIFTIKEQGLLFRIDMNAGYSQGIFLDQRNNRQRVRKRSHEGMRILNTFAYTGAFSVYAAMGGATTTTLDLAQPCLDWAKENMSLNGIAPESQFFCKGDTLHWLERFAKQGKTFHGIILDPPTFSRDHSGKVWRVETHYGDLVALASRCIERGGWMLCSTNCRKLSPLDFANMVGNATPYKKITPLPMPFDFPDEKYLKCLWLDF